MAHEEHACVSRRARAQPAEPAREREEFGVARRNVQRCADGLGCVHHHADSALVRFRAHTLALAVAALVCGGTLAATAQALAARSAGSPEQIAWVRSAASRFVMAELAGNGASACAILNRPLRATLHGRTCAQRWNVKLAAQLRKHGARSALRQQSREIANAAVVVHGNVAQIELTGPLIKGPNKFLWTENCWMLEG